MNVPRNIADDEATRVCRAQAADLLRQGWTAKAIAACSDLTPETVANVLYGRPLTWRTCGVVDDVHRALDGALAHYRRVSNYRAGVRVQVLRRQAASDLTDQVRTGYRWGASVESLAERFSIPADRVRLIVGDVVVRPGRVPRVAGEKRREAS